MRKALRRAGILVPADCTYVDVVNLYKTELDGGTLDLSLNSSNFDDVKFPLEPPSVFLNSDDTITDKTNTVMMDNISSFLVDDDIIPSRKSAFIGIMTSLVDLSPLSLGEKKRGDKENSKQRTPFRKRQQDSLGRTSM